MAYVVAFLHEDGRPKALWISKPGFTLPYSGDVKKRAELNDLDAARRVADDWNDYLATKGYPDRVAAVDALTGENVQ